MATTRLILRTSLQYKTAGRLTSSADQDYYLDKAEKAVLSDWSQFDPSILRPTAPQTATTDSSGVLELAANVVELELLQDSNELKYLPIDPEDRYTLTGYYFASVNTTDDKRKLVVIDGGSPKASATMTYIGLALAPMAAATGSISVIPEEFRDMIAVRAAEMWHRDQGPPMFGLADGWLDHYEMKWLARGQRAYKSLDNKPVFMKTYDEDAGGMPYLVHRTD